MLEMRACVMIAFMCSVFSEADVTLNVEATPGSLAAALQHRATMMGPERVVINLQPGVHPLKESLILTTQHSNTRVVAKGDALVTGGLQIAPSSWTKASNSTSTGCIIWQN